MTKMNFKPEVRIPMANSKWKIAKMIFKPEVKIPIGNGEWQK